MAQASQHQKLRGYGQALALASLGSQKQHMALYLMSVYGDTKLNAWFRDAYQTSGKKLDMGKFCIRFKTSTRSRSS